MSFRECSNHVLSLSNQCLNLKTKYDFSSDDARGQILSNYRGMCLCSLSLLNFLSSAEEQKISCQNFCRVIGLLEGNVLELGNMLEKQTRLSFVTMIQFQIEVLLRILLREFDKDVGRDGFFNIVTKLLKKLEFTDWESKREILCVPAKIRNSLHFNGIHHGYKGQSTKVMIDDIEFNFRNGKIIQTAGWEHICLAFAKGLEIIDEIFSSPKFGSIKYTIKNSFLGD